MIDINIGDIIVFELASVSGKNIAEVIRFGYKSDDDDPHWRQIWIRFITPAPGIKDNEVWFYLREFEYMNYFNIITDEKEKLKWILKG